MNLKNTMFVGVSAVALLFSVSCAKNLSYDDAKKWVADNYKSTETSVECKSTKMVLDCSKSTGQALEMAKEMLKDMGAKEGEAKIESEEAGGETSVLNAETFDIAFPDKATVEKNKGQFSVKGKSLTYTMEGSVPMQEQIPVTGGDAFAKEVFNDNGYLIETYGEIKNAGMDGLEGVFNIVIQMTFSF